MNLVLQSNVFLPLYSTGAPVVMILAIHRGWKEIFDSLKPKLNAEKCNFILNPSKINMHH